MDNLDKSDWSHEETSSSEGAGRNKVIRRKKRRTPHHKLLDGSTNGRYDPFQSGKLKFDEEVITELPDFENYAEYLLFLESKGIEFIDNLVLTQTHEEFLTCVASDDEKRNCSSTS